MILVAVFHHSVMVLKFLHVKYYIVALKEILLKKLELLNLLDM